MTQLNPSLESTLAIAKSSNSVLKNKQKSDSINTLKNIRALFDKYDACDRERNDLMNAKPEMETVEPVFIELPELMEYPEKPAVAEPEKKHSGGIAFAAFVALGAAAYLIGQFYLIPNALYFPKLYFSVAGMDLNEFALVAVACIVLGLIVALALNAKARGTYNAAVEANNEINASYQAECAKVDAANKSLNKEYENKLAMARESANQTNEELKHEYEETNAMWNLKVQSVKTTMKHLQEYYMDNYSKIIPASYADPAKITELIRMIETDDNVCTIKDALSNAKK